MSKNKKPIARAMKHFTQADKDRVIAQVTKEALARGLDLNNNPLNRGCRPSVPDAVDILREGLKAPDRETMGLALTQALLALGYPEKKLEAEARAVGVLTTQKLVEAGLSGAPIKAQP